MGSTETAMISDEFLATRSGGFNVGKRVRLAPYGGSAILGVIESVTPAEDGQFRIAIRRIGSE